MNHWSLLLVVWLTVHSHRIVSEQSTGGSIIYVNLSIGHTYFGRPPAVSQQNYSATRPVVHTEVRIVQLEERCTTESLQSRAPIALLWNNNLTSFYTLHTPSEIPSNKSASHQQAQKPLSLSLSVSLNDKPKHSRRSTTRTEKHFLRHKQHTAYSLQRQAGYCFTAVWSCLLLQKSHLKFSKTCAGRKPIFNTKKSFFRENLFYTKRFFFLWLDSPQGA